MVKPGGIFRTLSKSYEVLFVKRVNVFQPLIIFAKVSTLDIWQSSECASEFHINIHNSINNRAMVITDIFIAATPFSCLSILRWLHLSTTSGKKRPGEEYLRAYVDKGGKIIFVPRKTTFLFTELNASSASPRSMASDLPCFKALCMIFNASSHSLHFPHRLEAYQ